MKIVKIILIVIVVIIAIPFIVALFVKHDYAIEREVTINRPSQQVFGYIKMLHNQVNYSKWYKMDPNAQLTYTGTDGTVGFKAGWDSKVKNVGTGEQTIASISEGHRIDLDLHFIKPMEGQSKAYLATDSLGAGQTKVKWGFTGHMKYPFNFMLVVMDMDKMLGDDLSVGLTNLKAIMEK